MIAVTRCIVAVLLISSLSGVAFGQTLQLGSVQAASIDGVQSALGQWGNNVLVTCTLTRGQSLETLFSNNLLVSNMVAQWKANFSATPPAVPEAQEIGAALNVLVRAFAADTRMNWTAQDVTIERWSDLPGGLIAKRKVRAAFEILKADGLMCLSFLNRAEDEEAPQELVTAMVNVLDNPTLSALTHLDLYTTSADPDQYSEADMDLLVYAMDDVQLIRTEAPDRYTPPTLTSSIQLKSFTASSASTTAACCDRVSRSCVAGGVTGRCSICNNNTCCLGSTWCPI